MAGPIGLLKLGQAFASQGNSGAAGATTGKDGTSMKPEDLIPKEQTDKLKGLREFVKDTINLAKVG